GSERLILAGTLLSLMGIIAAIVATSIWPLSPLALFLPQFAVTCGNGMTLPNATAGALSARQEIAGAAAGVAGAIQIGSGAIFSMVASFLVTLWSPSVLVLMLLCAATSTSLFRLMRRRW
ncbi:MAG: Bcr/CflA family drug resistance efflux transporter, partial [Methylobacteriaceae bacterium]|nr:Bcr/CflA family drug resistance efflux transporter [Methylobacteriaceae bacterium]